VIWREDTRLGVRFAPMQPTSTHVGARSTTSVSFPSKISTEALHSKSVKPGWIVWR
jgi:hypothetical protein